MVRYFLRSDGSGNSFDAVTMLHIPVSATDALTESRAKLVRLLGCVEYVLHISRIRAGTWESDKWSCGGGRCVDSRTKAT